MDAPAENTPDVQEDPCAASYDDSRHGLRIASIFIILVTSIIGTLAPVLLRRTKSVFAHPLVFDFCKFFGSGVIIATAFMHLLTPAFEALGSECLSGGWTEYDWAPAIAMMSVYAIFFAEVAAYRIGNKRMEKLGMTYNTHADAEAEHGHSHAHENLNNGNALDESISPIGSSEEGVAGVNDSLDADAARTDYDISTSEGVAQLIAVAVLEFGVILHSIVIGLTLALSDEFVTLFIVIIFHQMFEGLGLGSRLSQLRLPHKMRLAPYAAGILYALMTPLGVAIGLGVRESLNTNGAAMAGASGTLDAFSAGILLYTGLVELLGHEILLNPRMMKASNKRMTFAFVCICLGSGLMALLAKWA
ncbi:hypothetical protein FFLO_04373 [Filobasidium floriforme]|uniref:Uncharacterized protein n=1 Tax=Filobasidium floriforme TaxID=5210 RepID=A0A8K0JKG4_9TREE|nr:hypothetical protein FFLO_04373 [Filobasidium floriforme]